MTNIRKYFFLYFFFYSAIGLYTHSISLLLCIYGTYISMHTLIQISTEKKKNGYENLQIPLPTFVFFAFRLGIRCYVFVQVVIIIWLVLEFKARLWKMRRTFFLHSFFSGNKCYIFFNFGFSLYLVVRLYFLLHIWSDFFFFFHPFIPVSCINVSHLIPRWLFFSFILPTTYYAD